MAKKQSHIGSLSWVKYMLPHQREDFIKYLETISNLTKVSETQKSKIKNILIPILQASQIPDSAEFEAELKALHMNADKALKQIGAFYKFREDSRNNN